MQKIIDSIIKLNRINSSIYQGFAIGSFNRKQIYGGLMAGQAIMVAYNNVSEDLYLHNLNGYYLKKGKPTEPIQYNIKYNIKTKTFERVQIICTQDDMEIASFKLSFKKTESPNSFVYNPPYHTSLEYDKCLKYYDILATIKDPNETQIKAVKSFENWLKDFPFTMKLVDAPFIIPKKIDKPVFNFWFQLKEKLDVDIRIKHALVGFMSDFGLCYPIVALHNRAQIGFIASLDHVVWFHSLDFDINQPFYINCNCLQAGNSLSLNSGSIWTEDKTFVTTIYQQGLIRELKETSSPNTAFT